MPTTHCPVIASGEHYFRASTRECACGAKAPRHIVRPFYYTGEQAPAYWTVWDNKSESERRARIANPEAAQAIADRLNTEKPW